MEIIDELELTRRGLYGGVVGYLDFAGDADAAIAIRTAVLRDGVAYVQAGGGIVADSDPPTEDQETQNKAAAVVQAISVAESFTSVNRRLAARSRCDHPYGRSQTADEKSGHSPSVACCIGGAWRWWQARNRGGGQLATVRP